MRAIRIFLLLCSAAPVPVLAGDVYKCTDAQGAIAFQDQPCAAGSSQTALHFEPPPADSSSSNAELQSDDIDPNASPAAPPPKPVAQPLPGTALPPMWICTRPEDSSTFMSMDGPTPPRMVPAGVLGVPSKSLASAYGSGGIGVSAPGVTRIPVDKSPQAAVASDYVAVQDQCERATREQSCTYLQQQFDLIHEKLRRAFKDEQAVLQPQEDALDHELDGC